MKENAFKMDLPPLSVITIALASACLLFELH
jgi:hypothetical protein